MLGSATEVRQLLLENNASQGSVSASVDPKIETLNVALRQSGGDEGLKCGGRSPWRGAGALCQINRSQEDGVTRTRDLQFVRIVHSAGAGCVHPPKRVRV